MLEKIDFTRFDIEIFERQMRKQLNEGYPILDMVGFISQNLDLLKKAEPEKIFPIIEKNGAQVFIGADGQEFPGKIEPMLLKVFVSNQKNKIASDLEKLKLDLEIDYNGTARRIAQLESTIEKQAMEIKSLEKSLDEKNTSVTRIHFNLTASGLERFLHTLKSNGYILNEISEIRKQFKVKDGNFEDKAGSTYSRALDININAPTGDSKLNKVVKDLISDNS